MARPRKTMKAHREILRHVLDLGFSGNETHSALGISRGTVQDCVKRAKHADLEWRQIAELSDDDLNKLLFPEKKAPISDEHQADWEIVLAELQRRGVKLRLLYEERVASQGYELSYSQFCRQFRAWSKARDLDMLQIHVGGEKLFLDFSGQTVSLTDSGTGEVTEAQIFVATFGASNYTYFEAVASQQLPDWINAHIRAFKYFGGLPKILVPDNLKSAVTTADRFDPVLNPTYKRFAAHYKLGVMPARSRRPKDKAKVEKGVQNTEYRALAKIRNRTYFSLEDLNHDLAQLRDETNNEPFQKLSGTRASWFAQIDKPALRALPADDFEFEEWITELKVPKNYHISIDKHLYSVHYSLVEKLVDVRLTKHMIEIMHNNTRAASHVRSWAEGQKTTADEHLAPAHAKYHGLNPEYFLEKGEQIGPNTKAVIDTLLKSKHSPQLSYHECFGLITKLKDDFGIEEVELACIQAIRLQTISYRVVKSILEGGVRDLPQQITLRLGNIPHANLRGPNRYH